MGSLSEKLTPPYYAAILNETRDRPEDQEQMAPADEMVILATRQPGFLGLETAEDRTGERVTVSYWRDIEAIEGWKAAGDSRISSRFGVGLADTCGIRVALVEKKAEPGGAIDAIVGTNANAPEGANRRIVAFLPAPISNLFGLLP